MTTRSIHLRNVSKAYPGEGAGPSIVALEDVSFSVADGERVGIIGPNGAGKSTLLQIIAGVNPPSSGEAEVNGRVNAILTIGIGVREEATGRENLYLDGAVQGKSRAEIDRHIDAMIEFADLGEFIDRPLRTYSTGMKARLAFAAIAFIEPDILIIDEALGVGDAMFAEKAAARMRALCAQGGIVLLVSHSLAAIKTMCDRAIWIEQGKVRMDGPSEDVATAYRDAINRREEAEIARKFGAAGASWSHRPGAGVTGLQIKVGDDSATVIESGAEAELCANLHGVAPASGDRLRIWIERNDGIVMIDETAPITTTGPSTVRVPLGRVDWRPFMYQAHMEIVNDDRPVAHAAVSFKIWSDAQILGGAPMVRTPPRIVPQKAG